MQENLIQPIKDTLRGLGDETLICIVLAIVAVILLRVAWNLLARRSEPAVAVAELTGIDVAALGEAGPPAGNLVLEHYHVPVRLAAVVVAPAGRVRNVPPPDALDEVYEAVVPGLSEIAAAHEPLVRRWPAQLSIAGFANAFFKNVRLPGQAGKGTVWSSAAGIVRIEGQQIMVGLVLCAAAPNKYGQDIIESDERWSQVLCVSSA